MLPACSTKILNGNSGGKKIMSKRMVHIKGQGWVEQTGDKLILPSESSYKPIGSNKGGNGWWSGSGYSSGGSYLSCSHDKKKWTPFLEHDGLRLFGAAKSDIPALKKGDSKRLVINCSGYTVVNTSSVFIKSCPAVFDALKDPSYVLKAQTSDEMLLDWDDQRAPRLVPRFWPDLIELAKKNDYVDLVFCCMGGHGRTGTALSCMVLAMGVEDNPDDAIKLVRKDHCKKAVETFDQIDYIEIVAMVLNKWKANTTDGHCLQKPSK